MPREKKNKQRKDGRFRRRYHGIEFYGASDDEAKANRDAYIRSEQTGSITNCSVSDYALPWLRRTYPSVSDNTYTGLAIHLQHLIDSIGNKRLSEVIPSDIKQIYADHYNGLSNTYILAAKQLYCSLFDAALADGKIKYNPARDKTAKPHKGTKPKEMSLDRRQIEWITNLCTDHRAYPAVMAMLYAGLRPQEMKAFDIDRDVDFENDIITVQETAHVEGQKYAFSDAMKTEWSSRRVPLFPPLKEALKGKHGALITTAHGKPITIQTWKVAWNSYIFNMETAINGVQKRWYGKKKGQQDLPEWIDFRIVPYTLRHAFCQMCRDFKVDINTCRKWMGHADTKMILKVYDAVSEDRFEQERQKVDLMFGGQNGGQDLQDAL